MMASLTAGIRAQLADSSNYIRLEDRGLCFLMSPAELDGLLQQLDMMEAELADAHAAGRLALETGHTVITQKP